MATSVTIPITPGSGQNLDAVSLTVSSNTVARENIVVSDPIAAAGLASVKAASTQSVATDGSLVVQINPNQPALTTALNVHDASPASQAVTNAGTFAVQVSATTSANAKTNPIYSAVADATNVSVLTATGTAPATSTFSLPVAAVLYAGATPTAIGTPVAAGTGTLSGNALTCNSALFVGTAAVSSSAPLPTSLVTSTSGGWSASVTQALSTTAITVKGSAGQLGGYAIYNPDAVTEYVFFYNVASPTVGGTTSLLFQIGIPSGATANLEISCGIAFSAGIYMAASSSPTSSVAPTTGLVATVFFK